MVIISLSFLLGVCTIFFVPHQWPWWPYLFIIFVSLIAYRYRPVCFKVIIVCCAGASWQQWHTQHILQWQLADNLVKRSIPIQATIISIPEYNNHHDTFIVRTTLIDQQAVNTKLRLNWYSKRAVHIGEQWYFEVKLKPPQNFTNHDSFDYETWLFAHGIRATGYIDNKAANQLLQSPQFFWIDRLREKIKSHIFMDLPDSPYASLITALSIGVREGISQSQWQVMQRTGTNHLFAIAGLHIGFVTSIIFFGVSFIWKRLGNAALSIATPRVAAAVALLIAWIYSALAGFALPTERAAIMVSVFMGLIITQRSIPAWSSLALALLVVLVLNPLSVLTDSFWLSFFAVACIIYTLSGRIGNSAMWRKLLRLQYAISLGILPLTILFFQNASLIAPIANAIVIPLIGFIAIPLSLLSAALIFWLPAVSHELLIITNTYLHYVWIILAWFAAQAEFSIPIHFTSHWQVATALLAVILWLSPKRIPGRYWGVVLFLLSLNRH